MKKTVKTKTKEATMITLKKINKSFNEKTVFKGVNLSIFESEVIALVGPNGSGKSTLLKIIAKIIQPDSGKIETLLDLKIAYFPQEIPLECQNITVKDFFAKEFNLNPEKAYSFVADLFGKLELSKEKLDSAIKNLSGGEKSKLMLISIMKSQANILLLDEPTNNLDLRGLIMLENFINSSSCGFLIVSHDRKFLEKLAVGIIEINENTHGVETYSCGYNNYLRTRKNKEKKRNRKIRRLHQRKKATGRNSKKQKTESTKNAKRI